MLELLISALFALASGALAWSRYKALRRVWPKLRFLLALREAHDGYYRHHPAGQGDQARWN